MTTEKTVYEAPALVDLGSFETLTQGSQSGASLDFRATPGVPATDVFS